ncbi:hypothetical protein [Ekhidna sp. To15]|uniref:hypothetical protein n=1 Tax=Ekhidna sp. To15 TaxID=3395267 RepID=UPI003F526E12
MKKIIPFLLIICVWLIGCNDDDSSGNFVGVWVAKSVAVTNCQDDNRNGTNGISCDDISCYRLELNEDGSYTYQRGLGTEEGTWDVNDFLTLCVDEENELVCENFSVQFSGISMILTADSTSSGCTSSFFFDPEVQTDTIQ